MSVIQNPDSFRNYNILETFNAGIELKGFEVKSIIAGKGSLKGAYVSIFRNELYLKKFYVPAYQEKNVSKNYNPERDKKLLLKRKEINYLISKSKQAGLIIIPLKVYTLHHLVKTEIALAKSLKKYEKRDKIKKRDFQRQQERALKKIIK